MQASKLYAMQCISPVHIGTGQGVGIIDMPLMRERVTEWPVIPGSSVKGVKRDYYSRQDSAAGWLHTAFGTAMDHREGHAGALVFSDYKLFAFPLASLYGVFAYVTCPLAIKRLQRDAQAVGCTLSKPKAAKWEVEEWEKELQSHSKEGGSDTAIVGNENIVTSGDAQDDVFLDEFQFKAVKNQSFGKWAKTIATELGLDDTSLSKRLVLVSDEAFHYFVTMCCEVTPRIRIDTETQTVKEGALWYEEYLPTETIMYGIVWCDRIATKSQAIPPSSLLNKLEKNVVLQIGGNTSVGKGLVRFTATKGETG